MLIINKGTMKLKDLTNKKFGKLTLIEIIKKGEEPKENAGRYWKCLCDCGNIKNIPVRCFHLKKYTRSCGCLRKQLNPNRFHKNAGEAIRNSIIRVYKSNSKNGGHVFSLTLKEIESLFKGNCFYCRCPPRSIRNDFRNYGSYVYNGIDRKDNSKGYFLDNCVSCCWDCNRRKN